MKVTDKPMPCVSKTRFATGRSTLPMLAGLLLLWFSSLCQAAGNSAALVYQDDKSFSVIIARNIASRLQQSNITTSLITLESLDGEKLNQLGPDTLIVSLGSEASNQLLQKNLANPILSLLVPKQAYSNLQKSRTSNNPWSVLFIDQPIERQLLLIKHLLGENKTIGTLLGPYSVSEKSPLMDTARLQRQKILIEEINITDQLIASLKTLTNKSDVVLALPDPVAFNRNTIRGVLLLTYRENIPLIGFSKSYVKAGAIASLFSEYRQISDQTYRLINNFFNAGKFDRDIYYPDDFAIAINRKVARTLNINLKPEDTLIRLIKRDERKQ